MSHALKQVLGSTRKWLFIVTLIGYKIFFPSDRPLQLVWICFPISNHVIVPDPGKLFPARGLNLENKTSKPKGLLNSINNNNDNNNKLMIKII